MTSQNHRLEQPNRANTLLNQKMKTIESIGTFNQTPVNFNNFDQSIICKRQVFVQNPFLLEDRNSNLQSSHNQPSETSKASRIESDMGQIARMKMLFQSRVNSQKQNASRLHNKSMDRSPNARSIQKHILKPTHTPSFNRFQPKNISYSIIEQKQPISLKFNNNQSLINENQNRDRKHSVCVQSSSKKRAMDCSQISSKFEEYEFGYDFNQRSAESRISDENQHLGSKDQANQMKRDTTVKRIDFEELRVINPGQSSMQISEKKSHQQCSCQQTLSQFMQQTSCKLAELTERLMYLQHENGRLRQIQEKVNQQQESLRSYQERNETMQHECNELRESNYKYQAEKEELETLLKEILFKREKEKFQKSSNNSKENTYRQEQQAQKRTTLRTEKRSLEDHCYRNENEGLDFVQEISIYEKGSKQSVFKKDSGSNSRKRIEPLGLRGSNVQQKEEGVEQKGRKEAESKMKVQNLLSKLQIKIEKS